MTFLVILDFFSSLSSPFFSISSVFEKAQTEILYVLRFYGSFLFVVYLVSFSRSIFSFTSVQNFHLCYSNVNICWLVIGLKNWVLLSSYWEGFSSYWIFQTSKVTAAWALSGSQNTARAFPKYLAVVRNLTPTSHFQWCNQFSTHWQAHEEDTQTYYAKCICQRTWQKSVVLEL